MAQRTFFAIACVVLSVHAAAWGQGPGYSLQGPYGPYGPPAGPWGGGTGVMQAAYQQGPMQAGPMQPGPMQAGPMQGPMLGSGPQAAEATCGAGCACGAGGAGVGGGAADGAGSQHDPQWESFGDFLYIRPRNANVAYGTIFNGPFDTPPTVATPIQVAQPGVASIDFHPGWRVGFAGALDECNSVVATFTHFEGENRDTISTNPPDLIRSMVSQPSTWTSNAFSDWLEGASDYSMIFSLADIDLRWTFENQNDTRLSLLAGVRYASLDQRLDVTFTSTDVQNVHSQVNFEGAGLRIGFEGQRRTPFGLVFYGRTVASVVAGTARCAYTQTSGLIGPLVDTGYPADRVVPILDAEVGTGLSFWNDKLRFTVGYSFSGWFNLVRTDQFIGAVQTNNFTGMHDTLTFDGFVGRLQLQF